MTTLHKLPSFLSSIQCGISAWTSFLPAAFTVTTPYELHFFLQQIIHCANSEWASFLQQMIHCENSACMNWFSTNRAFFVTTPHELVFYKQSIHCDNSVWASFLEQSIHRDNSFWTGFLESRNRAFIVTTLHELVVYNRAFLMTILYELVFYNREHSTWQLRMNCFSTTEQPL